MPPPFTPSRGDIWLADLNPIRGHEQGGQGPVLIVSINQFNLSRADLLIVMPITSTLRSIPFHVVVQPPEGGLTNPSAILCEGIRSISKDRLVKRWGQVLPATMTAVEDRLRILTGL